MIEAEQRTSKKWELTPEGKEIVKEGSHEVRVFNSIPPEGLVQSELMVNEILPPALYAAILNWSILEEAGAPEYPILVVLLRVFNFSMF